MNSVSMPSQPAARARSATAATTSLDTVVGAMASHPTQPGRASRLRAMLEHEPGCVWCGRALGAGHAHASLEHVVPRLKGGPAWPENEVVAGRGCNRARGQASPAAWLGECEARGWTPDRALVERKLVELRRAIAARGGQRRARPYLDGQLRRLGLASRA